MRVILEGNGRLAIDIIPGTGCGPRGDQDNRPHWPYSAAEPGGHSVRPSAGPEGHPHASADEPGGRARSAEPQRDESSKHVDLGSFATVEEEELFSVLMFLLRRTLLQTGQIPSHAVLDSVVRAFDILLTVGKLPPVTDWDRSLLTVLLVALEQIAARHGRGWLDELITHVRASIRELDSNADDNEDDDDSGNDGGNAAGGGEAGHGSSHGPGNSVPKGSAPKNNEPESNAPATGYARGSRPSDGRITSEWKGAATDSADSSEDSMLDTATTKPVKKKE